MSLGGPCPLTNIESALFASPIVFYSGEIARSCPAQNGRCEDHPPLPLPKGENKKNKHQKPSGSATQPRICVSAKNTQIDIHQKEIAE